MPKLFLPNTVNLTEDIKIDDSFLKNFSNETSSGDTSTIGVSPNLFAESSINEPSKDTLKEDSPETFNVKDFVSELTSSTTSPDTDETFNAKDFVSSLISSETTNENKKETKTETKIPKEISDFVSSIIPKTPDKITNNKLSFNPEDIGKTIIEGAEKLGISPYDYAAAMAYESRRTFNPWVEGPKTKWGVHRGTIQYGAPQRKRYGVTPDQSAYDQITISNVQYLKDAGVKPGDGLEKIYAAINGGSANRDLNTVESTTGRSIRKNIENIKNYEYDFVNKTFGEVFSRYGYTSPDKKPEQKDEKKLEGEIFSGDKSFQDFGKELLVRVIKGDLDVESVNNQLIKLLYDKIGAEPQIYNPSDKGDYVIEFGEGGISKAPTEAEKVPNIQVDDSKLNLDDDAEFYINSLDYRAKLSDKATDKLIDDDAVLKAFIRIPIQIPEELRKDPDKAAQYTQESQINFFSKYFNIDKEKVREHYKDPKKVTLDKYKFFDMFKKTGAELPEKIISSTQRSALEGLVPREVLLGKFRDIEQRYVSKIRNIFNEKRDEQIKSLLGGKTIDEVLSKAPESADLRFKDFLGQELGEGKILDNMSWYGYVFPLVSFPYTFFNDLKTTLKNDPDADTKARIIADLIAANGGNKLKAAYYSNLYQQAGNLELTGRGIINALTSFNKALTLTTAREIAEADKFIENFSPSRLFEDYIEKPVGKAIFGDDFKTGRERKEESIKILFGEEGYKQFKSFTPTINELGVTGFVRVGANYLDFMLRYAGTRNAALAWNEGNYALPEDPLDKRDYYKSLDVLEKFFPEDPVIRGTFLSKASTTTGQALSLLVQTVALGKLPLLRIGSKADDITGLGIIAAGEKIEAAQTAAAAKKFASLMEGIEKEFAAKTSSGISAVDKYARLKESKLEKLAEYLKNKIVSQKELGIAGALQTGGSYKQAKEAGISEENALLYGAGQALLGFTNIFGAGQQINSAFKSSFEKTLFVNSVKEFILSSAFTGGKEGLVNIAQDLFQTTSGKALFRYLQNENKSGLERIQAALSGVGKDVKQYFGEDSLLSFTLGAGMGALGTALQTKIIKPETPTKAPEPEIGATPEPGPVKPEETKETLLLKAPSTFTPETFTRTHIPKENLDDIPNLDNYLKFQKNGGSSAVLSRNAMQILQEYFENFHGMPKSKNLLGEVTLNREQLLEMANDMLAPDTSDAVKNLGRFILREFKDNEFTSFGLNKGFLKNSEVARGLSKFFKDNNIDPIKLFADLSKNHRNIFIELGQKSPFRMEDLENPNSGTPAVANALTFLIGKNVKGDFLEGTGLFPKERDNFIKDFIKNISKDSNKPLDRLIPELQSISPELTNTVKSVFNIPEAKAPYDNLNRSTYKSSDKVKTIKSTTLQRLGTNAEFVYTENGTVKVNVSFMEIIRRLARAGINLRPNETIKSIDLHRDKVQELASRLFNLKDPNLKDIGIFLKVLLDKNLSREYFTFNSEDLTFNKEVKANRGERLKKGVESIKIDETQRADVKPIELPEDIEKANQPDSQAEEVNLQNFINEINEKIKYEEEPQSSRIGMDREPRQATPFSRVPAEGYPDTVDITSPTFSEDYSALSAGEVLDSLRQLLGRELTPEEIDRVLTQKLGPNYNPEDIYKPPTSGFQPETPRANATSFGQQASNNPSGGNPPGTNPPGGNPPGTNPPGGNPPGSNVPPGGNPPSGNPPGTNPPGTNPSGGNPPGTNPPGTNPPGGNPPGGNVPPGGNPKPVYDYYDYNSLKQFVEDLHTEIRNNPKLKHFVENEIPKIIEQKIKNGEKADIEYYLLSLMSNLIQGNKPPQVHRLKDLMGKILHGKIPKMDLDISIVRVKNLLDSKGFKLNLPYNLGELETHINDFQSTYKQYFEDRRESVDDALENVMGVDGKAPYIDPIQFAKDFEKAMEGLRNIPEASKVLEEMDNERGDRNEPFVTKIWEKIKNAAYKFTRTWPEFKASDSPLHAKVESLLNKFFYVSELASANSEGYYHQITKDLSKEELEVFQRFIVLSDIKKELEGGGLASFGIKDNLPLINTMYNTMLNLVNSNKKIQDSIRLREVYRRQIIDKLRDVDISAEDPIYDDPRYFHRIVTEFQEQGQNLPINLSLLRQRGFQMSRIPEAINKYITDFELSEKAWVKQATELIKIKETFNELNRLINYAPEIKAQAFAKVGDFFTSDWENLIDRSRFAIFSPKESKIFRRVTGIDPEVLKGAMESLRRLQQKMQSKGKPVSLQDVLDKLDGSTRTVIVKELYMNDKWVVPKEFLGPLERLSNPEFTFEEPGITKSVSDIGRQWVLLSPLRFISYRFRNFISDLEAIAIHPKILTEFNNSLRDIKEHFLNPKPIEESPLKEELELGVLDATQISNEIRKFGQTEFAKKLEGVGQLFVPVEVGVKGLTAYLNFMHEINKASEGILRVAAYRYFKKAMQEGKLDYAATNPKSLAGLDSIEKAAALLASDLLGNYMTTPQGIRDMSKFSLWFARWIAANGKRNLNLMFNSWRDLMDSYNGNKEALAKKLGITNYQNTMGLGGLKNLVIYAGLLQTVAAAFNMAMYPDAEKELNHTEIGKRPHLIIDPESGTVIDLALGSADFWKLFGVGNIPTTVIKLMEDQEFQANREIPISAAKNIGDTAFGLINPLITSPIQIAFQTEFFPSLFTEDDEVLTLARRPMRDTGRFIARSLAVQQIYDYFTDNPRFTLKYEKTKDPILFGIKATIANSVDPTEAVYWASQDIIDKYIRENQGRTGTGYMSSDKSFALFRYKTAIKMGMDIEEAKKKYLTGLDITEDDIKKSILNANPLQRISDTDKIKLIMGANTRQRFILYDALRYWNESYQNKDIGMINEPKVGDILKAAFPNPKAAVYKENIAFPQLVDLYKNADYSDKEKMALKSAIQERANNARLNQSLSPEDVKALQTIGITVIGAERIPIGQDFKKTREEAEERRRAERFGYPQNYPF